MESRLNSETLHQDAEGVRQFFEQWALYQKVVAQNYLHHREAYAAIEKALLEIPGPFSFLELGSGDARFTAPMLSRCDVGRYEAVDLSETALDLARKNLESLPCIKKFTRDDFFKKLPEVENEFHVIFIGLSFHHLPLGDKREYFVRLRRILRVGGSFLFYEPIMSAGETREEVMRRFDDYADTWGVLTVEELRRVKEHVHGNDYPETEETFSALATAAGFASTRILYQDPERLYAVFQCS